MAHHRVKQYTELPFEIFSIDGLFTEAEIDSFRAVVEDALVGERTFTASDFKNGKVYMPQTANMYNDKLENVLQYDAVYKDARGQKWAYTGVPDYIMYAQVKGGQLFGIHTDTGCDYYSDPITKRITRSKFTVLTYLNDDFSGGHTQFYDDAFRKSVKVIPKRGRTLVFDIDLFHAGEVVSHGVKNWLGTELVCTQAF